MIALQFLGVALIVIGGLGAVAALVWAVALRVGPPRCSVCRSVIMTDSVSQVEAGLCSECLGRRQ